MSAQNKLPAKRARRAERTARKVRVRGCIPFGGPTVSKKDVLGQRYLYWHGLPHSATVAAVNLEGDVVP